MSPTRLPILAAVLSFIIPGLGQFVVHAWIRGAIWLVGWLGLVALTGAGHSSVAMVLMVIAAADAYLLALAQPTAPSPPIEGGGS